MSISVPIIVRNAVSLQYPLHLVSRSVIGLSDEILISLDPKSSDDTLDYVHDIMLDINSRYPGLVRYTESVWDLDNISSTGEEFSRQTNIAINECSGDWILSLQADEAIHEDDFDRIKRLTYRTDFDAYSFERLYFYGDINTIRVDWNADIVRLYRKGAWKSCGDGMNSVSVNGSGAKHIDGIKIYHYSRIGDPEIISKRILSLDKLFHPAEKLLSEDELEPYKFNTYNFDCMHRPDIDVGRSDVSGRFMVYTGTHPKPFVNYKG